MDSNEIKKLYKNLKDETSNEMLRLVNGFKEYVKVDHEDNPRCIYEGFNTRPNYGVVESKPFWPIELPPINGGERKNYYCYLSESVNYTEGYTSHYSNAIFYNDEIKTWFAYDRENNKYSAIADLDIETQIKFLQLLENFLN